MQRVLARNSGSRWSGSVDGPTGSSLSRQLICACGHGPGRGRTWRAHVCSAAAGQSPGARRGPHSPYVAPHAAPTHARRPMRRPCMRAHAHHAVDLVHRLSKGRRLEARRQHGAHDVIQAAAGVEVKAADNGAVRERLRRHEHSLAGQGAPAPRSRSPGVRRFVAGKRRRAPPRQRSAAARSGGAGGAGRRGARAGRRELSWGGAAGRRRPAQQPKPDCAHLRCRWQAPRLLLLLLRLRHMCWLRPDALVRQQVTRISTSAAPGVLANTMGAFCHNEGRVCRSRSPKQSLNEGSHPRSLTLRR